MRRLAAFAALGAATVFAAPTASASRSCASVYRAPLVGFRITTTSAVPGCAYARTVIARWFGKGQPMRGFNVGRYGWACGMDSTVRASCYSGRNGGIYFRVRYVV